MAYADEEAGTAIIPWLHESLPKVHQELLGGRKGAHRPYWTRALEVDARARRSFHRTQTMNG